MKKKIGLFGIWVVINFIVLLTAEGDYKEFFPVIQSGFNLEELLHDYDISEFVTYIVLPILLNMIFSKSS